MLISCASNHNVRMNDDGMPQRHAFISLQMSSLRQGNRKSISFKKLSSLSSTPFPAVSKRNTKHHQFNATTSSSWSNDITNDDDEYQYQEEGNNNIQNKKTSSYIRQSPFPTMPSPLFINLAQSQFELLSNSLVHGVTTTNKEETIHNDNDTIIKPGTPKISSMSLYLPKENENGALEFVPVTTYPNPSKERLFIATSAEESSNSGMHQPPSIPISMGVLGLPGFFKAKDLIPSYPFVSSANDNDDYSTQDSPISVSVVEEIESYLPNTNGSSEGTKSPTSLSVTLFNGLDTLGVFMIWPYKSSNTKQNQWKWTSNDKLQVTRAAKSLALALSMDNERASSQLANEKFRVAMADSLHQVKSPLQALRTFGKLLQRQLAEENIDGRPVMERVPMSPRGQQQALKLAEDMLSQGERVIGLIEPMDALVQNGGAGRYLLRGDIKQSSNDQTPTSTTSKATAEIHYQLPPSLPVFGEFEIEMAFPQDILGSIVYESQAISRERGINFDVVGFDLDNDLPGVTVCPKHLNEAVSNILDNAIKYVTLRRKGKIGRPRIPHIKVSLVSNEPPLQAGATLYIEDNGPGIPESERDKVFERGYRGFEEVGGSGLGLPIARDLISRMGGMVDMLEGCGPSKLDGTTVRIILFREPESI